MWHREATLPGSGATVDVLFLDTEVIFTSDRPCTPNSNPKPPHQPHQRTNHPPPKKGFSVSNVTEAYDAQVFAAATLLSSLLVYNSMHVLHANELEYLDLLVRLRVRLRVSVCVCREKERDV